MTENPLISVIIPVYNPGKHLYRCLNSIINQTYHNLEILLIDDGSTDGSSKVCDDFCANDSRIKVVHQKNAGVSRARNVGLEMASGDYASFPDSDDYIELDTYEYVLRLMQENHAEAACFEYYITYQDKQIKHIATDHVYGTCNTEQSVYELLFSNRSFLCTKLLPMDVVKNIRFFEDIYRDEDTIFCMLALHQVANTVFDKRPLYHYVQSEESACRGVFRPNQLSALKAIPFMESFLSKNYPAMLPKWRCNYLHLMIMLYSDMYFDDTDYSDEKKMVYKEYLRLRKDIPSSIISSIRNRIKFFLFGINPEIFCFVHKEIHKLKGEPYCD